MSLEKVEIAFNKLNEAVEMLAQGLDLTFLDAYTESIENLIDNYQVRIIEGEPSEEVATKIEAVYNELKVLDLSREDWRKTMQLVLLKGLQQEPLQANHQLTPDTIGFLFVFLIQQLSQKKELRVLDIASGMGNLLLTVVLNLEENDYQVTGYGVDIDETLLSVAAANTELVKGKVNYFHQDALQDLLLEPVDVVIADLPIGYYPNDEKAQQFISAATEGHSYAHHLLMEQGMKYVKEAGFGLFLLPTNFLESEQSDQLKKWLSSEVYLQGMVQLPESLFKTAESRKSIVILQRRGGEAKQLEVLLASLGSLKNAKSMTEFVTKFKDWTSLNL